MLMVPAVPPIRKGRLVKVFLGDKQVIEKVIVFDGKHAIGAGHMGALHPNFIVGIGGSAGALSAYKALLDALPSNTGMAFVIFPHIPPTANSQLAKILSNHTAMPVMMASTAMPVRANHVYVIPPNANLLIESFTFKVASPST